ncbi:MAG: hypothetical protein GWM93_20610 [Gemmatimonadetes bacterium]|uniref:Uncharacterized protein n=1 Tax=Candidatus Kutchimonas denitrificans TaxID=3056748 RepID=A0AAE5CAW2_9BACT|nr:hypothetical protein [Candidatus Kutchimonas denitrificans]NIT69053.1 hypothetical protein [Gemmatimonadota bacterium]NIY37630.1 hypothetical protein [Gemmatimonadota bacterium]
MRRRWSSSADDPGWTAGDVNGASGSADSSSRQVRMGEVKRSYTARERLIDCPHRECPGLLLTGTREVERHGSAARIALRCTREPEDHEVTLSIEPYTAEETDVFKSQLLRGDPPACVRCGSEMDLGSVDSPDGWGNSEQAQPAYFCPWCGLRWVPSVETKRGGGHSPVPGLRE